MTLNTDLVCALDEARQLMRDVVEETGTKREVYPGWTVKQLISHVTGWDEAIIASLRLYLAGVEPVTPAHGGFDPFNASTIEERRYLSYDEVVKDWEDTRMVLKNLVMNLPERRLNEVIVTPWGPRDTIYAMVMEMALHEKDHVLEIRRK